MHFIPWVTLPADNSTRLRVKRVIESVGEMQSCAGLAWDITVRYIDLFLYGDISFSSYLFLEYSNNCEVHRPE